MKEKELRAGIRSLLLKEARAYQAYYDLANSLESSSAGRLHANQTQGKIKGREPHVRLMLTDSGQKALSATLEKIKSTGGYSKLFSDQSLASEFGSAILSALPDGASYVGPSSKILSKSFPAFDIEYEGQTIPVVVTIPGSRVQSGAVYQNATTELIAQELTRLGHNVGASKTAAKGSQAPDVSLEYDGKSINAEVKGPGGKFFDKTVQRGKADASAEVTLINDIAAAMSAAKGISSQDLESYIDNIQKQQLDSGMESVTAGYIGDEKLKLKRSGEPLASGALPTEYFQIQPTNEIIDAIKNHWASGGDSYFVVSDGTTSHIWYTGFGDNPLNAPIFDIGSITGQVKLSTYGSAGPGRLRVALSSKFNLGSALSLSKNVTESLHPGLLESLSGLMVEAYAPGTKVGLVPMAAKPYHAGHHSLVETAAAENDQVLLYISLSDRKRKGELTIRGEDMERIWKEEIEKILPGNVTPVYGGIPVRKVYEILGDAEEKLSMGVEPPVYTVYSDPIDTGRNYPAGSRAKYFPTVASKGYVKFAGEETPEAFTRGEGTPDVSGTKMRAALQCGDEAAFAEGLPTGVDKDKIFNMLCPIQRMKSTVEEANFRMAVKRAHRKAILQEQSLYDTFVKPFSDVVAVAKLTAQDVLAASILNLRLWWNIGDLEGQAKAFEKYDKAKQEIKAKMKPYMDAIDARLAESDVSIIAAAVAPGFFFGQMGLEGAYNASKGTLDFLKGAGLELPVISTLFDGEEPESRKTDRPKDEGLLGGLKKLFFGESAQLSDLPIILEQEEKKDEPKPEKPPFDEAMATYLKDSGVEEKLEEMGRDLLQASKEYYEQLIAHVTTVAEITNELNAIDTTSDNVDIDAVRAIMEKAKQSGLPGAEDFEAKIDQGAEKLSDNPEFEEKADELADKAEKQGDDKPGATDEEEKKAAANIAVVEFIDSFREDSKEGLPQLIKSVREKIEEDKPQGINVKALNTSDIGKEYLQLLNSVESKLDELAGVAA